jgi:hypothetical protein
MANEELFLALESTTFYLTPGADNIMRSADPYGLVGNGISEAELKQPEYLALVQQISAEASDQKWTRLETREVLLKEIQLKKYKVDQPFEILLQAEILVSQSTAPDGAINCSCIGNSMDRHLQRD